jgi:hypothetical protein
LLTRGEKQVPIRIFEQIEFYMKKHLWIVSLSLYVLAFFLPVYATSRGPADFGQGIGMLFLGWIAAFAEQGAALAWFANPFFIVALCTTKKYPVTSIFFASFSILWALCFLKGGEILLLYGSLNESSGHMTHIGFGYWVWLCSMVVILAASVFRVIDKNRMKWSGSSLNK